MLVFGIPLWYDVKTPRVIIQVSPQRPQFFGLTKWDLYLNFLTSVPFFLVIAWKQPWGMLGFSRKFRICRDQG